MTDTHAGCVHGAAAPVLPPDFMAKVMKLALEVGAGDIDAGARWLVHAVQGYTHAEHLLHAHPGHAPEDYERAYREANPTRPGPDLEAWLFGFRWKP